MSQVLIIYNPVSGGRVLRRRVRAIKSILDRKKVNYAWHETKATAHQPLQKWIHKNLARVVVIGGDGTIREVAQYLLEHHPHIPLGIVAQGSANVLALSLKIPVLPLSRALHFALETKPRPLDVLKVNRRYIGLIGAGQGYDALFLQGATRSLKRKLGFFAYVLSFARTFFFYRSHSYHITVDGKRHYASGKAVIVFNVLSLGGRPVDPQVSGSDGICNVAILDFRSFADLLMMVWAWLRHSALSRAPTVRTLSGKHVAISQKHGTHIQVDGDVFPGRTLQVEVLPAALSVVYGS